MSGVLRRFIGMARPGSEAVHTLKGVKDRALKEPPRGWLSSAEIAAATGRSARTVRDAMNRAGVKGVWAYVPGSAHPCIVWERRRAKSIIACMNAGGDIIDRVPRGWMSRRRACRMLGVEPPSIRRLVKKGLTERCVNLLCSDGVLRMTHIVQRSAVVRLVQERRASLLAMLEKMEPDDAESSYIGCEDSWDSS